MTRKKIRSQFMVVLLMFIFAVAWLFLSNLALADTPPPNTVKAKTFSGDGLTSITATGTALDVNVVGGGGLTTVNQGTAGLDPWLVAVTSSTLPTNACQETGGHLASIDSKLTSPLSVTGTFWQATQPVSGTLTCNAGSGTFAVGGTVAVSNFPATQAVTGTFWQTTQPISAASLPLPTGAATETTLSAINTKTPALGQALNAASIPVVLTASQLTTLTPPTSVTVAGTVTANAGTGTFTVDGSGHTQPVSGTFWQATQPVSLASLPALANGSNTIGAVNINGTVPISGSITATNSANGNTGSAVPAQATQVGGSDGTNLRALKVSSTGVLSVDGSAVTQPVSGTFWQATQPISGTVTANAGSGTFAVSAAALPLPSGASTSALQTTGNTSLSSIDTKTPALGQALAAASVPVVLTASQLSTLTPLSTVAATQSGSWAVTANAGTNLNTSALALDTSVNGILRSQGSTTSGQTGPIIQGAVTTAAPTYTTAQTSPLSLTTAGALRTDSSATTQPVSVSSLPLPAGGATSALQTTGNSSLSSIDSKIPALGQALAAASVPVVLTASQLSTLTPLSTVAATQSGTWNINNVSGTVSLPTGASTAAKQPALGTAGSASADVITVQGITSMTPLKTDGSGTTQPISGTVTANAGSGTFAVSAAALPLPTGAATDASVTGLHVAQGSTTSGQTGELIQGAVTTAAPTYTTAQTSPLSLTTAGALRTDSSGTTQPVSAASLPLPTGAATAAKQPSLGTAGSPSSNVITVQGVTSMTALKVDGSAVTQPVSGTFWQATQPVSGTVAATQSGTWNVGLSAGSNVIGSLTANQSVNNAQVSGNAISTGNGVAGTGVQRVAIASDNTAFNVNASPSTPAAATIKQAAITVGTTAVRATNDGLAPPATRSLMTIELDCSSTSTLYIGSSSVTSTGATRGLLVQPCQIVTFNNDAGDYYMIASAASQTVYVMEQE